MPKSIRWTLLLLAALLSFHSAITAQTPVHLPPFSSIEPFAFESTGPVIRSHTEALKPFTVAGEQGVLLGQQDGTFEAWAFPVKILSHFTIEANVEGYSVPIDVNQQSAEIEVRPDRTIITYSHVAFTVHQIMFSPNATEPGTGPIVLFEFDCLHPTDFTFRFTPNLQFMWPMRNEGVPGVEWVTPHAPMQAGDSREENDKSGLATSGYYVLHSDYPDLAAAVAIPGATAGILAPYQERPQVHPVELKLHIDPARDHGRLYPLLMAIGTRPSTANSDDLFRVLRNSDWNIYPRYQIHADSYKKLLANSVSIDTPDKSLNEAFQWAVVSIEQLKAKPWVPDSGPGNPKGVADPDTALVAGYYASGDSARPGFGWFFGRDSLYTLYAVNGYGDFALAKSELEFLIHRQRPDGKIMHEYSQTAAAIDWRAFPYMYAAADSTPLFLLATLDFVRSSGDTAFLTANREAIEKAWEFETSHSPDAAHGGNGIYTNEQGTGWVESWPGGMPHQEIYLALLDQQASAAMAQIEDLLHDAAKSQAAKSRAESVAKTINDQFYDADKHCYAFSRNKDGSLDRTTTVYPALAWWSELAGTTQAGTAQAGTSQPDGSHSILQHPEGCLQQLAAHTLNTDWGLRDVSNEEKIYDGMSYHQGSVWPLFTGWAALAEYRANQPLAGYQMLMENVNLTKAQDLGAVTELLSGDYNVPFGRSTSHQLWSSAMVITPILRGLFGISIDAQSKTITVNPHLPASWDHARVANLPLPGGPESLTIQRTHQSINVSLSTRNHQQKDWTLRSDVSGAAPSAPVDGNVSLKIPVPLLEIFADPITPSAPGSRTHQPRVLAVTSSQKKIEMTIEGQAGSEANYFIEQPDRLIPHIAVSDGYSSKADSLHPGVALSFADVWEMSHGAPLTMHVVFPPGENWKTITVTLTW